jgi:endonuclease YncB( thermonuclease family)
LRRTERKELYLELRELGEQEEKAQKEGRGIWNKNPPANAIRPQHPEQAPTDLVQKLKGSAQTGIIEVKSGSSLRITLVPSFFEVTVMLFGVDCPSSDPKQNEPFGREANSPQSRGLNHLRRC